MEARRYLRGSGAVPSAGPGRRPPPERRCVQEIGVGRQSGRAAGCRQTERGKRRNSSTDTSLALQGMLRPCVPGAPNAVLPPLHASHSMHTRASRAHDTGTAIVVSFCKTRCCVLGRRPSRARPSAVCRFVLWIPEGASPSPHLDRAPTRRQDLRNGTCRYQPACSAGGGPFWSGPSMTACTSFAHARGHRGKHSPRKAVGRVARRSMGWGACLWVARSARPGFSGSHRAV